MSAETTIYGAILAHGPIGPRMWEFYEKNREAIYSLPEQITPGSYQLQRSFFTVPIPQQWGFYRNQMIHFGASYNHLEAGWAEWLEAFERLLRSLYWVEANLHLHSEYFGRQDYRWTADFSSALESPPRPIQTWKFEGGLREFPVT